MSHDDSLLSSYLAIKGPLSETTFRAFSTWDLTQSVVENIEDLKRSNSVGASSIGWLNQFIRVLKRRYDLEGADRALIELVQQGWHIDDWRPVQLWHMSRNDDLLRMFLVDWLFEQYRKGIVLVTVDAVLEFVQGQTKKHLGSANVWTPETYRRVASGLLKTAAEFHLMRGRVTKQFTAYRLPEKSFVYLLHTLMEREQNTRKVIESSDWRLFLMTSSEVEEELLRLHQYGKLRFERAGTFLELTLPCRNANDYVRSFFT
jgi:hypothetical protein